MSKFPVKSLVTLPQNDINREDRFDEAQLDALANRCVSQVTDALKAESTQLSKNQRDQIIQVFYSMRHMHRAIRKLLKHGENDPISAISLALVRIQLETLYGLTFIVEKPDSLSVYMKDGWKKTYVRHLLMKEEGRGLPRVHDALSKAEPSLEGMRKLCGVTDEEKLTVESEELDVILPTGFVPQPIPQFPTPAFVIRRISDSDRKKMLSRLYPEYQYLRSFVHLSPHSSIFPVIFDKRQSVSDLFTTGQKEKAFHLEISGPANWLGLLSIVQSCSEFVSIYPTDLELIATLTQTWKILLKNYLLAQKLWELRTKRLLGALQ